MREDRVVFLKKQLAATEEKVKEQVWRKKKQTPSVVKEIGDIFSSAEVREPSLREDKQNRFI